jgi:hypothetical protein
LQIGRDVSWRKLGIAQVEEDVLVAGADGSPRNVALSVLTVGQLISNPELIQESSSVATLADHHCGKPEITMHSQAGPIY